MMMSDDLQLSGQHHLGVVVMATHVVSWACQVIAYKLFRPGKEFGPDGLHFCGQHSLAHPGVPGGVEHGEP